MTRVCILHVADIVRGGIGTYLRTCVPAQRWRYGAGAVAGLYPAVFAAELDGVFEAPVLALWHGRGVLSLVRYGLAIARTIRRLQPDIVHAHSTFPGVLVRLAVLPMAKRRRPKIVYCAHGWSFLMQASRAKLQAYAAVERWLHPFADVIVHISQYEANAAAARGIARSNDTVIYNGLPPAGREPQPARETADTRLTLLFVGRLDRQKGADILFSALKCVNRADMIVHVVGEAVVPGHALPLRASSDQIVMHGWLAPPEVERLYRQADVVVMPSRWEGFGYVALEAMRAGCAVFASNRGALPELVVERQTGRLFNPERPDELAQLIETAEAGELRRMGVAGQARFRAQFTAEQTVLGLFAVYDGLLANVAAA